MYTILGATGHTGLVVTEKLLAAGKKVRAVGRSNEKLKPVADKGAEGFVGSVEDAESMAKAFAGADTAYVLNPGNMAIADFRAYQKRVVEAVVSGLRTAKVRNVVLLSSVGAEQAAGTGPVVGLHEFEEAIKTLPGVNALFIRAAYFMENFFANIPLIKQAGINGGAIRSDLPVPMIHTRDIGDYAAKRLLALDFKGIVVQELQGQRDLTMPEATKIIGTAIGRPDLAYVQFAYEDMVNGLVGAGLQKQMAEAYAEMSRALNEGRMKYLEPRSPANSTPTTIEEFAKTFGAVFKG